MGRYTGKRPRQHTYAEASTSSSTATAIPPAAFTRAYEAELVRGPCPAPRLIRVGDSNVWADRHDILHLLDTPPSPPPAPPSPTFSSWSLASDAEDTFALSGDEEHAAHAEQRRRYWVDGLREARLREREKEDEEAAREQAMWAEMVLNEPPTPEILKLMEHTARALAASPNPAALEMRIMTRHAADARFAFLRTGGESSAVWARVKAGTMEAMGRSGGSGGAAGSGGNAIGGPAGSRPSTSKSTSAALTTTKAPAKGPPHAGGGLGGLGGLGGYGSDSDSDSGASTRSTGIPPPPPGPPPGSPPPPPPGSPPRQPSPPPSPP